MSGKSDFNDFNDPRRTRQIVGTAMNMNTPYAPRFAITRMADVRPVLRGQWLVRHLLPARGLTVIYGPPGCGKSFVALHLAVHVAMGLEYAGKRTQQAAVIYIAAEGGFGFANRIVAIRNAMSLPDEIPLGLITVAPNLGTGKGDVAVLVREVEAQCKALGWTVGLIIVDTLARVMMGGDENSTADMNRFVKNIDDVGKAFRCTSIAVHHTGKDVDKGMRGNSSLHGACDGEWAVGEDGEGKWLFSEKMKDGPQHLEWRFHLYPVDIGVDETNENVSSCVVKIDSDPAPRKQKSVSKNVSSRKLKGQKALAYKAIRTAIDEMGVGLPASNHYPNGTRGTSREHTEIYARKLGFLDSKSAKVAQSTLDRLLRELHGDKHIGRWGEWLWLVDET